MIRAIAYLSGLLILLFTISLPNSVIADSVLIDAEQAQALSKNRDAVILQLGFGAADRMGYIAGAVASDFQADGWRIDYPGLPGMVPPPDKLNRLYGRLGLEPTRALIIVAGGTDVIAVSEAARVYWTLSLSGFRELYFLDGGVQAWLTSNLPMTETPQQLAPTRPLITFAKHLVATADSAFGGYEYGTAPLDLRPGDRHRGETGHPLVDLNRGSLHGAANIAASLLMDETTGRLKPIEVLRGFLGDWLGPNRGPVVVFSDTGLRAALGWFILGPYLGQDRVMLYDGSFVDWEGLDLDVWDQTDDMGGVIG